MTWIKMSDRKPEEGQLVVLAIQGVWLQKPSFSYFVLHYINHELFKGYTHWMPIEEPK